MAKHVKKGDTVEIKTGVNKGATGKVMRVIPSKNRVLVSGVNLAYKHVRPTQKNPQGGRINVEQPIHISNVLPVNTKSSKGGRVGYKVNKSGKKKRVFADGHEI